MPLIVAGAHVAGFSRNPSGREFEADSRVSRSAAGAKIARPLIAPAVQGVTGLITMARRPAPRQDLAFAVALLFDELARHVRGLDAGLRSQVVAVARTATFCSATVRSPPARNSSGVRPTAIGPSVAPTKPDRH